MTRAQCELIITHYLKHIRDVVLEYNPKIEQISLAIMKDHSWAFAIDDKKSKDGETRYLLNVTTENGFNPGGEEQ